MTAAVVTLAVAVALLTVLVIGLLRSHAEILKALHELGAGLLLDPPVTAAGVVEPRRVPAGATPTSLVGQSLDGELVSLSLVGRGDTLIAFLSSGCTTCQDFWRMFQHGVTEIPGDARLVVVTRDPDEESPAELEQRAPTEVAMVLSSEAWDDFGVPGSPYFAYLDGAGRVVGEGSAGSWPQVVQLLGQARADAATRTARTIRGSGRVRHSRDEQALAAAGIAPGDPSLSA